MKTLAPIVLFVYNRPWHTEQTLNALKANDLADQSVLYIYADGPKKDASPEQTEKIKEVRKLIRKEKWCTEVHIIEAESNKGLADSIVAGVTEVVNRHGKIIVLEDDIVTSPGFLKYMNDALDLYESEGKVMHITGYMYPHLESLPETFFFNVPLCWGWATWKRAWSFYDNDSLALYKQIEENDRWQEFNKFGGDYLGQQLKANISGSLKTWFIKWHTTTFLGGGYTLYPGNSLVQNIGFDSSGIHNGTTDRFNVELRDQRIQVDDIPFIENPKAAQVILRFYALEIEGNGKSKPKSKIQMIKKKIRGLINKAFGRLYPDLRLLTEVRKKKNESAFSVRSVFGKTVKIYEPFRVSNSIIGNYTYIAENSKISKTVIGKFCSIGPNLLCGWGIHPIDSLSTAPMFYSTLMQNGATLSNTDKIVERKAIYIGNDVFIGANVTILDGITIGDGAIIGAGAVVSKDIPPYAIAVGCPIKILKYRFNDSVIELLLKIRWWDFSDEKLDEVEKYFFHVNEFIDRHLNA